MTRKRFLTWTSNLALYSIVVFGLIALLNYLSARHYTRFDVTPQKQYSLSSQTVKILENLEDEIKTIAFMTGGQSLRNRPKRLLEQYEYRSGKFRWEFVDPDKKPQIARKYGINRYNTFVVEGGFGRRETISGMLTENELTNAIIQVSSKKKRVVYFTEGHGEKDIKNREPRGYRQIAEALENENFKTDTLLLSTVENIPEDADVVIVAGPAKDFFQREIDVLKKYLLGGERNGGKILFLVDPQTLKDTLNFLREFGVNPVNNVIVDKLSRMFGGDYLIPTVATYDENHEITKDFRLMTFFPICRSLKLTGNEKKGVKVQKLASTLPGTWGETDHVGLAKGFASFSPKVDNNGPLVIAAAVEVEPEKREKKSVAKGGMVVIGDSDFVANSYIGLSGNKDFFLNTVNWLAGEKERIAIRPKDVEMDPLLFTETQVYAIAGISLLGLPFIVLVAGIWVNIRRGRS